MQKAVFTETVLCTRGRFLSNFTYTAENRLYTAAETNQSKRHNEYKCQHTGKEIYG